MNDTASFLYFIRMVKCPLIPSGAELKDTVPCGKCFAELRHPNQLKII